jgi:hypothetical protein
MGLKSRFRRVLGVYTSLLSNCLGLKSIHHIAIISSNYELSKSLYDVLGFSIENKVFSIAI